MAATYRPFEVKCFRIRRKMVSNVIAIKAAYAFSRIIILNRIITGLYCFISSIGRSVMKQRQWNSSECNSAEFLETREEPLLRC
jgi:hypothetical protein